MNENCYSIKMNRQNKFRNLIHFHTQNEKNFKTSIRSQLSSIGVQLQRTNKRTIQYEKFKIQKLQIQNDSLKQIIVQLGKTYQQSKQYHKQQIFDLKSQISFMQKTLKHMEQTRLLQCVEKVLQDKFKIQIESIKVGKNSANDNTNIHQQFKAKCQQYKTLTKVQKNNIKTQLMDQDQLKIQGLFIQQKQAIKSLSQQIKIQKMRVSEKLNQMDILKSQTDVLKSQNERLKCLIDSFKNQIYRLKVQSNKSLVLVKGKNRTIQELLILIEGKPY